MKHCTRRQFIIASASALTLGLGRRSHAQPFKHSLKKAVIQGRVKEDALKKIKDAGFDGVEAGIVSPAEAAEARKIAEKLGMRIHSVLRGWAKFNSDKKNEVEQSLEITIKALRAAKEYGADAILLVPGRIGGMPIPDPWNFRIKFDGETGHLIEVVEGDNEPYGKYIEAHNHAYDTCSEAIRRLIPVAEETGVIIAVENVWNNLFVDVRHMAFFIDSFRSPWVRAYFDIANHVKYAPPEQWIRTLGARIVKCHVKDFKLNPDGHGGKFVNIREGSVNWSAVRRALDDVGYDGWMTIEGSGKLSLEERSRRLDLIIAGK